MMISVMWINPSPHNCKLVTNLFLSQSLLDEVCYYLLEDKLVAIFKLLLV